MRGRWGLWASRGILWVEILGDCGDLLAWGSTVLSVGLRIWGFVGVGLRILSCMFGGVGGGGCSYWEAILGVPGRHC